MPTLRRLAIILARGGSKGFFRKNLKKANGKFLIVRSIEHALASAVVQYIVVSINNKDVEYL